MADRVCIVGLGYVGLQLGSKFAKAGLNVVGFDTDASKVEKLREGVDTTGDVDAEALKGIAFTADPSEISGDFIIIAVPTPIKKSKQPDLRYVRDASRMVGKRLKKGTVVVLESTVYPGVTEEVMVPILEAESGLKCGRDFKVAYSPERINPGDKEHTLRNIVKVVGACDDETLEAIARLYGKVVKAGIFKARDIKTAEAAKVIENIQRDLNIALMNELAMIFKKMDIEVSEVLKAAYTKWNFARYYPGLVGGHCIPVDPYYLVYKAVKLGYHPQVILSGRSINDHMPKYVAELALKAMNQAGKVLKESRVLLLGLTYKEDVRDIRTSQAKTIAKELKEFGVEVHGYDPLIPREVIEKEFKVKYTDLHTAVKMDCLILTVPHNEFKGLTLRELKKITADSPVLIDIRGLFQKQEVEKEGFLYVRL